MSVSVPDDFGAAQDPKMPFLTLLKKRSGFKEGLGREAAGAPGPPACD